MNDNLFFSSGTLLWFAIGVIIGTIGSKFKVKKAKKVSSFNEQIIYVIRRKNGNSEIRKMDYKGHRNGISDIEPTE